MQVEEYRKNVPYDRLAFAAVVIAAIGGVLKASCHPPGLQYHDLWILAIPPFVFGAVTWSLKPRAALSLACGAICGSLLFSVYLTDQDFRAAIESEGLSTTAIGCVLAGGTVLGAVVFAVIGYLVGRWSTSPARKRGTGCGVGQTPGPENGPGKGGVGRWRGTKES